nr:hypothetical protein [Tanacetum cinerariifolium]
MMVNVARAREKVGSQVVQQSGIQCFNCKELVHFAKECRKPKRVKDSAYHKEKMLLYKQAEQATWLRFKAFHSNPDPVPQRQDVYSTADAHVPSQQELDLLFGPLYNEFFNAGEQLQDDEFTNPFCASTQEVAESSLHNIGNSNVPTFNQPQVSKYRWTKDYPLEQVHGNPLKPVQTRRQLATDPEMYMYTLTVSTAEPKNIKEAMADSA